MTGSTGSKQRIDDDQGVAVRERPLELLARLLGEDDQRAVGRAVHEAVEERHLALVLAPRRPEDEPHVMLVQRLRSAGEDPREVGRIDERHQAADEPGTAGLEPARAPVRRVAVLPDHPADELPGLVRDVATAVDDTRDGGDRDARELRDLPDRDPGRTSAAAGGICHDPIEAFSGTFRKASLLLDLNMAEKSLDSGCTVG